MAKGYRKKTIASSTRYCASPKLGRVFVEIGGTKQTPSFIKRAVCNDRRDDCIRSARVFFLERKVDATADASKKFLAHIHAHGVLSEAMMVKCQVCNEISPT